MKVARTCPSCGYTAYYGSARPADAHHPRRTCDKHRRSLEEPDRRAERLQARVTRECTHSHAHHRHGTRVAYVKDRCRCPDSEGGFRRDTRMDYRSWGTWESAQETSP